MTTTGTTRHWLWVDVETTGLGYDPAHPQTYVDDALLEVAAIITTPDLVEVSSFGPVPVVAEASALAGMNDFVRAMHTGTGLLQRVASPQAHTSAQVDGLMSKWMDTNGLSEKVILAGSSVKLDFEFIRRHLPDVFSRLGYRVIDVSSFKETLRDWSPGVVDAYAQGKTPAHEAMADIRASVAELGHYRQHLFNCGEAA